MLKRAIGLTLSLVMIGIPLASGQGFPLCSIAGRYASVTECSGPCHESGGCDRGCCGSQNVADGIAQRVCKDTSRMVFLAGTLILDPIPLRVPLLATSVEQIFHPRAIAAADRPYPEHYGGPGVFLQNCCFRS